MTFRILVTNDDGISAAGLKVAEEIAVKIAGKSGTVITVAPAVDQSGVSHSISYLRPSMIEKHSISRYSVEGSPADCVLAGVYYVMKDNPPNVIISGVNNGHNLSDDVAYSGTIGAAMEGALQGIKSIALSQCYSKSSLLFDDSFEVSRSLGASICEKLLKMGNWMPNPYQTFYNVNFPAVKVASVLGVKACKQDKRPNGSFNMEAVQAPNGRTFLLANHRPNTQKGKELGRYNSDVGAASLNYVTVTPLKADLTSYNELSDLENIVGNDF